MKRRAFVGGAFAGVGLTGAYAAPPKAKAGDIPMTEYGKTGVKVTVIAQGGARMDLHPTIPEAAAHVRRVYEMGVTYFDCARILGREVRTGLRHWLGRCAKEHLADDQDYQADARRRGGRVGNLAQSAEDRLSGSLADA